VELFLHCENAKALISASATDIFPECFKVVVLIQDMKNCAMADTDMLRKSNAILFPFISEWF
jgi:hypothetical protein